MSQEGYHLVLDRASQAFPSFSLPWIPWEALVLCRVSTTTGIAEKWCPAMPLWNIRIDTLPRQQELYYPIMSPPRSPQERCSAINTR